MMHFWGALIMDSRSHFQEYNYTCVCFSALKVLCIEPISKVKVKTLYFSVPNIGKHPIKRFRTFFFFYFLVK